MFLENHKKSIYLLFLVISSIIIYFNFINYGSIFISEWKGIYIQIRHILETLNPIVDIENIRNLENEIKFIGDLSNNSLKKLENGKLFPTYFPLFAFYYAAIYFILPFLGIDILYTFTFGNVLLQIFTFFFITSRANVNIYYKIFALSLVFFSPTFFYSSFTSHEYFIFINSILLIVSFNSKNYYFASFFSFIVIVQHPVSIFLSSTLLTLDLFNSCKKWSQILSFIRNKIFFILSIFSALSIHIGFNFFHLKRLSPKLGGGSYYSLSNLNLDIFKYTFNPLLGYFHFYIFFIFIILINLNKKNIFSLIIIGFYYLLVSLFFLTNPLPDVSYWYHSRYCLYFIPYLIVILSLFKIHNYKSFIIIMIMNFLFFIYLNINAKENFRSFKLNPISENILKFIPFSENLYNFEEYVKRKNDSLSTALFFINKNFFSGYTIWFNKDILKIIDNESIYHYLPPHINLNNQINLNTNLRLNLDDDQITKVENNFSTFDIQCNNLKVIQNDNNRLSIIVTIEGTDKEIKKANLLKILQIDNKELKHLIPYTNIETVKKDYQQRVVISFYKFKIKEVFSKNEIILISGGTNKYCSLRKNVIF